MEVKQIQTLLKLKTILAANLLIRYRSLGYIGAPDKGKTGLTMRYKWVKSSCLRRKAKSFRLSKLWLLLFFFFQKIHPLFLHHG